MAVGRVVTATAGSDEVLSAAGARSSPGTIWIQVHEDLDLATVETARAELTSIIDGAAANDRIMICLEDGTFVDLRGMRMLVQAAERARLRGATFVVAAPSRSLRLLVDLNELHDELPMASGPADG